MKKKYAFTYTQGDNASRSILNSAQISVYDSSNNLAVQPTTTFSYSIRSTPNWNTSSNITFPPGTNLLNGHSIAVDFNGDGYTDILTSFADPNSITTQVAYINNGDGTWATSTAYTPPVIFYYDSGAGLSKGYTTLDLNGDQLPELFRSVMECNGVVCGNSSVIYINTGSGWVSSTDTIPVGLLYLGSPIADMADFNGDGLVDIYSSARNFNGNNFPRKVYLNNGDGTWLDDTAAWTFPYSSGSRSIYTDLNGDGISDIIFDNWYYTGGACNCTTYNPNNRAYIGDGKGAYVASISYISPYSYSSYPAGQPSPGYDWGNRVFDINNDGLVDLVYGTNPSGVGTVRSSTYVNTSNIWSLDIPSLVLPSSILKFSDNGNFTIGNPLDMDADGIQEIYYQTTIFKNQSAKHTDLLSTITMPSGGTVAIAYQSSGKYKDLNGNLLNAQLPFAVQTVRSITTTDPVASVVGTSSYTYSGGVYYYATPSDRKFAGFEKVSESRPDGSVVVNYYHQGNGTNNSNYEYNDSVGKIGYVYRTDIVNSSGTIQARSTTKYNSINTVTGAYYVYPTQTVDEMNGKNTATAYIYDTTTGNLSSSLEYGKVVVTDPLTFTDAGLDIKSTEYTYATDASSTTYKVSSKATYDQVGTKVNETKYYYDMLAFGSLAVGNNTKVSQLKTGSTFIDSVQKTYNSYGHITSSTDARNKTTQLGYDTNNLYIATVTNPLLQVMRYVYEYNTGKPTEVIDQNGFTYRTSYDGLGRVLSETIPDAYGTSVTKTLYTYTDIPNAVSVQKTDYLNDHNGVETYQYFDGLNRLVQERKEAEVAGTFNVRDIRYNNIALVESESLPYVATGAGKTSPTKNAALYTTNTYDPLQRVTAITNSIGVTSNIYNDWKTTVTDPNGKVKKYYKDAYNNLVKVDEVNGSATYSTNYTWNLNNKLTNITDALGNVRNFTYDGLGQRLTAEDLHNPADTSFGTWTYVYDLAGNLTQTHNPENKIVHYTYDDINRVKTENYINETGIEIAYDYDTCPNGVGKLCTVTQSTSKVVFEYTPSGLVSKENREIHKSLFSTSFLYDRQGNVVQSVSPDQDTFYRNYNNAGLLEKIQYGQAGMKSMMRTIVDDLDYSPVGQITYQKNGNSTETVNTYDSSKLYRLTNKITTTLNNSPSGHKRVNALVVGGGGGVSGGTGGGGAGGYQASTTLAVLAQAYPITVGAGGSGFNNGGNSIFSTLTALGGGAASDGFSSGQNGGSGGGGYGQFVPQGNGGAGNVGQGNSGGNGFGMGSATTAGGGGGASTAGTNASSGQGGNGGNGVVNSISGSSVVYAGGGAGRAIIGINGIPGTGGGGAVGSNGIDGLGGGGGGQVAGVDTKGGSGVVIIAYRTDGSDGVLNTSTGGVKTTSGAYTIHTFTGNGIFTVNPPSNGSARIQDISYTYDNNGNITQIVDASDTAGAKTVTYTYDDLNRMLSATATNVASGQSGYTYNYTYDAIGNITNGPVGAYVYNGISASNWANPHAATSIAGTILTYDKSGNMLSDEVLTNTWNYKQQLVQVEKDKNTFEYTYDHEGNRLRVMSDGEDTYYPNKFYSVDVSDKRTKNVFAGDQLVATIETSTSANNIFYNHTDHLGSVNVVTDASGTQTNLLDYFPYGSKRIESGTNVGEREFIGQIFDDESGLSYLNARYYDGNRGRFISQDPLHWDMSQEYLVDPQQMNSYSYGRGNPLKYIDPNGKKVELVVRPVFTKYDGHLFYHITPENPDQINVNGVPAGTKEFSIGGYNRGGFLGIGNKLTPEIGYEGGQASNTDLPYLLGQKEATARITIMSPEGQSDTDFINALGTSANNVNKESYFTFGQRLKFGNANSNNFAHEIGSQVGVGDQVTEFSSLMTNKIYIPGGDRGLPTNSLRQMIRQGIDQTGKQISKLFKN